MKSIRDLPLRGRKLFLRVDFNVPLENGRVSDDTRIVETLPTVRLARENGARVICASHLGKAKGKRKPELSLSPVAVRFAEKLGSAVRFVDDCIGPEAARAADALADGEVLLLENLRFHAGEESNDPEFAKALASLAEVYVDDAFGAAHRAHASVVGVPEAPEREGRGAAPREGGARAVAAARAGTAVRRDPRRRQDLGQDRHACAFSRAARTFCWWAAAWRTTSSARWDSRSAGPCSRKTRSSSRARSSTTARTAGKTIALPSDFVVAKSPDDAAGARTVGINKIPDDLMALDVGPKTIEQFARLLSSAKTIFWNGPMGVFEKAPFDKGTRALAMLLADSKAVTVVGGGESVQAAHEAGVADRFTHVSTGGGASLEFLAEGKLPGIEALD